MRGIPGTLHSTIRSQGPQDAAITCALSKDDGIECDAVPAGALRWNADLPAVGDWVRARRVDATLALIETVEPRTTCISRRRPGGGGEQVLAANVDLILIVMGLDGDYNLRRLERYLVLATASGAAAMVALNKRDVCPEWPARLAEVQALTPHLDRALGARVRSAHRRSRSRTYRGAARLLRRRQVDHRQRPPG